MVLLRQGPFKRARSFEVIIDGKDDYFALLQPPCSNKWKFTECWAEIEPLAN